MPYPAGAEQNRETAAGFRKHGYHFLVNGSNVRDRDLESLEDGGENRCSP